MSSRSVSQPLARNTAYLTGASIAQKAIAFVYFLVLSRALTPDDLGSYLLALSLTTVVSVVADVGVTQVVIREVAQVPARAREAFQEALGLKIPFVILAAGCSLLLVWSLGYDPLVFHLVSLALFVMAADAISLLGYGCLRGLHRLQYEALGIFSGQLLTTILGVLFLALDLSLGWLIVALLAGSVFNAVSATVLVGRRLGWNALIPRWSRSHAQTLLRAAAPFAISTVFVKIYSYLDTILLSKFLDTTAVALYGVPYKITYAFQFLPMSFVAALYPRFSATLHQDRAESEVLLVRSLWYMAVLALPLTTGISLIAPDLIALAGSAYAESIPVLRVLVFVLIPIFLDFPIGSLLNAAHKQHVKTALMGLTMVVNAVLNVWWIPMFGVIGAAYAAMVSFTFLFVAGAATLPSLLNISNLKRLFVPILPIVAVTAVMFSAAWMVYEPFGWLASIPVAIGTYLVGLWVVFQIHPWHRELWHVWMSTRTKPWHL